MSDQDCIFKGVEGHQLSLNFSVMRIKHSCAPWKIFAHNMKSRGSRWWVIPLLPNRRFPLPNPHLLLEGGDGMTPGLLWDCRFLCFFSCSPWQFGSFQWAVVSSPHSQAGQAGWARGITMLFINLSLLNRKNGPAGRSLNPCHFTAGGRRTS